MNLTNVGSEGSQTQTTHTEWFYLHEVQEQAEVANGDRRQNTLVPLGVLGGGCNMDMRQLAGVMEMCCVLSWVLAQDVFMDMKSH